MEFSSPVFFWFARLLSSIGHRLWSLRLSTKEKQILAWWEKYARKNKEIGIFPALGSPKHLSIGEIELYSLHNELVAIEFLEAIERLAGKRYFKECLITGGVRYEATSAAHHMAKRVAIRYHKLPDDYEDWHKEKALLSIERGLTELAENVTEHQSLQTRPPNSPHSH